MNEATKKRKVIQTIRRKQVTKTKKLTREEMAELARQSREYCDAPFGKGMPGCETLVHDLADYNREIDEMKAQSQYQKIHEEIPGQCWKCSSRSYKICKISSEKCNVTAPNCLGRRDGHHMIVLCEAEA